MFAALLAVLGAGRAIGQFCSNCIFDSAAPQNAQFNVSSATVRGVLTVGVLNTTSMTVSGAMAAASFAGAGAALTSLNASALTSGSVGSALLAGAYPGLTGVGTLAAGTWQANTILPAYGGTGADLSLTGAGAVPYFSAGGVLSPLASPLSVSVLMTAGSGAAPVWTSSPTLTGQNFSAIPLTALTSGTLPAGVQVPNASLVSIDAAKVSGDISGGAAYLTSPLPISQLASGTLPTSIAASSITPTGVNAQVCGASGYSCQTTIRADGRISAATQVPIFVGASSVAAGTFPPGVIVPLGNLQAGTLPTSVAASSITPTGIRPDIYGGSGYIPQITFGADGRATSATQFSVPALSTSIATSNIDNNWSHAQTFQSSATFNAAVGATGGFVGNLTGNASGSAGSVAAQGVGAGALNPAVLISTANVSPGFNGPSELVQLNGSGALPPVSGANLTNLPTSSKSGFLSANNGTLGVGTFSFGYTNQAVTISSMSVIVTVAGSGGTSGTVWSCCYAGSCVSVTTAQGAAIGSSYTGNGAVTVPAGGEIVLQMTSTGETTTPTVNAVCGYQ